MTQPPDESPGMPERHNPYEPGGPSAPPPQAFGTKVGGFFAGVGWLIVAPIVVGLLGAAVPGDVRPMLTTLAGLLVLGFPVAGLFSARYRMFCAFMFLGMAAVLVVTAGACVVMIAAFMSSGH